MYDKSNIGLIDSHPECVGSNYRFELTRHETVLNCVTFGDL